MRTLTEIYSQKVARTCERFCKLLQGREYSRLYEMLSKATQDAVSIRDFTLVMVCFRETIPEWVDCMPVIDPENGLVELFPIFPGNGLYPRPTFGLSVEPGPRVVFNISPKEWKTMIENYVALPLEEAASNA